MRYLLDTHTLIWATSDRAKIPKPTLKVLSDPVNPIYVSVVSFWEISLKFKLGKIHLEKVTPDDFLILSKDSGFTILGITPEEACSYYKLPLKKHRDPFDRMLIWQSIQNNLTLISKDMEFDNYSQCGLKRIW